MPENKVVRVSVIPTSKGAGGYTLSMPDSSEVITKKRIKNQLSMLMAGRAAEEIFFGRDNITVGAQNDIERATLLAVDYVTKYGMDDDAAFVNLGILSEKLNIPLASVEKSVKELSAKIYAETFEIIESNIEAVQRIALLLVDKEVINEEELNEIIGTAGNTSLNMQV